MHTWMARALLALLLALPVGPAEAAEIPIEGRVLDDQGNALAAAGVALLPVLSSAEQEGLPLQRKLFPPPADRAASGADGRFRLAAPEIGLWRVRVEARGFVPVETSLLPLLRRRELEPVRLERDVSARIHVVDPEGHPLPKALVWAEGFVSGRRFLSLYRWYPAWRWAEAGADGTVMLPRSVAESLSVSVLAPGYPVFQAHLEQARSAVEAKAVPGGCERRVEVRDPTGRPVAGAVLSTPLFSFPESAGWELGTTGQDGSVMVRVRCGSLRVEIAASGGRRMTTYLPYSPAGKPLPPLRISLPTAVRWTGRVLAAGSREPIAGALVWSGTAPREATRSDARGDFVLAAPLWPALAPPASFSLSAAAAGHLAASLEVSAPGGARAADGGPAFLLIPVARLEGVVVDAADRPVAEAEVSAQLVSSTWDSWVRSREHSTRSDAAGRFLLEVPPQERHHPQYLVQAVRDGFAPSTLEIAALEPGAARSDLRLVLRVGRQASGRVLGPDSQPVAGAEVLLIPELPGPLGLPRHRSDSDLSSPPAAWPSASSNPEGSFTLRHVVAGRFDLVVKAGGFVPFTRRGISVPGGEQVADLGTVVLDPGLTLEGLVVDSQGRPIAGATVDAGEAGAWFPGFSSLRPSDAAVRTGPDGRFRLQDLERDQAIDLTVSHDGHTSVRVRQVTLPATEPLRIVLQPAAQVSGRVVNDRGEPVTGADVSAFAAAQISSSSHILARERSGPGGVFRLDVEPGQIRVKAQAKGFLPSDLVTIDVLAGRETENVVLQVRPGAVVEGRVTGPDGHPLAGAEIQGASGSIRTDGEGRYRLEGIPLGPATFEVTHARSVRASRELDVQPGINHLDVQIPAGTTVSGRVMDAEGRPVEGAQVLLGREETLSGADGGFRFSGVLPGTWSLGALKAGFPIAEHKGIEVQDSPVHGLELRFERGSAITGKILGLSAGQLSETVITAAQPLRGFASGKVDAGRAEYRIDGVIPGDWTLLVAAPDLGLVRRKVTVPPDGTDVVFDLDLGKAEGLTLSGRIVRAGQPIGGAMIMVAGDDVEADGVASSTADGAFRVVGLVPGRYQLSVLNLDTALRHSETVELDASREILVTVHTAKVSGQVVLPDGSPAAGAAVELRPQGQGDLTLMKRTAATDSGGAFLLGDAAPGSYRITAESEGYAQAEAAVEVPESGDVEGLQLRLSPAAGLVVEVRGPGGNAPPFVFTALLDGAGRTVAASREVLGEIGRIHLRTAPAGRFLLVLSGQGFATVEAPVTIPGDAVGIDLAPETTLRVTVPELARQGRRGALRVTRADGRPFRSFARWGELVQEWRAIGDGSFNVEGLPAGAWKLRVTAPDGKIWEKDVTTAEAVAGAIEAVLDDGAADPSP